MAEPIAFEGQNGVLKAQAGDVGDLPVSFDNRGPSAEFISCWELSVEEQLEVMRTGKVWLHVWYRHPPVYVSGHNPFETSGQAGYGETT